MDTIAFIGGGNMAGAIVGGLIRSGRKAGSILVVDPGDAQREKLHADFGVRTLPAADATLEEASLVVWAVKPQYFQAAALPCAPHVERALHLSVMAGIRSEAIAHATRTQRVVRAMPNTPALIGQGISGLFARDAVGAPERTTVEHVLAPTGQVLWVDREEDLDAVTALSGSGPAYVFYFVEAMMSLASTNEAFTLLVTMASLDRLASDDEPAISISLTVERTFSTRCTACSTAVLSASLGTSPVMSTTRL